MMSNGEEDNWIDGAVRDAEERFDFVRFTFADIHGIGRSKLVPRQHFRRFFKKGSSVWSVAVGVGTCSEVVEHREILECNHGSALVRPMPNTLHALPWAAGGKRRIGEVLCETSWMESYRDGAPQAACPRFVARTQLRRLSELGYQLMTGYEAKFNMYRSDGEGELTSRPLFDGAHGYNNLVMSEHEDLMCWMVEGLCAAGVDVEAAHVEYSPGYVQLVTNRQLGMTSADQMFTLKTAAKEMGMQRGLVATFMTSASADALFRTAQDYNISLWKGDHNAFQHLENERGNLSTVGRHWIAGLLKHAGALTALCRPTVNCYRVLDSWLTPQVANWGFDNRAAMLRVKVSASPQSTYIEDRLPSGPANPYIVLAATVAAGMDGLVNRLEPPGEISTLESDGVPLPRSLPEALTALESDKVLCEALGEEFVRWFVAIKRDVEIDKVNRARTEGREAIDVEREMYLKMS